MVRGLVRAAEMIEQRDGGKVWDDEVGKALTEARTRGWGKNRTGTLDERAQVEEWMRLRDESENARAAVQATDLALSDFVEDHCRKHPLSSSQCRALLGALKGGYPLCCEAGKEVLDDIVDPIWAEVLNEWAYEALDCRGRVGGEVQMELLEAKLRKCERS